MKQLANCGDGIDLADWLVTVNREIAQIFNDPCFG
jgi:hypothetical protein